MKIRCLFREMLFTLSALLLFYWKVDEAKLNLPEKKSVAVIAFFTIIYLMFFNYIIYAPIGLTALPIIIILVFYIFGSILYVKTYFICYSKKEV
jgi:hypothetical protein